MGYILGLLGKAKVIVILITLTMLMSTSCSGCDECDPDKYGAQCKDGQALNCIERPYFDHDGEGWIIDSIPCGERVEDSLKRGPECVITKDPNNKPFATCSFDREPGAFCSIENTNQVCVDGASYHCLYGVRTFQYLNSESCEDD